MSPVHCVPNSPSLKIRICPSSNGPPVTSVGIEVKASATAHPADFKGLKRVREAAGRGFRAGLLLYDGDSLIPFAYDLYAAPFSIPWS